MYSPHEFAFKGVASNLVTYLTDKIGTSNSSAAKFVNSWVGFTSILPLIVTMLAEPYLDRHSTILASAVFYTVGLLALTLTSIRWPWIPTNKEHSITFLASSLYMISIGQGGYNSSLQTFAADQLDNLDALSCTNTDEKSSNKKSLFFQWWYFTMCCGSLLGFSVMSYIQDTLGWGLGFAIPTLSMILSIFMFLGGNRFYIHKSRVATNDSFGAIFGAIKASVSKMINGENCTSNNEHTMVELELQEKAGLYNQEQDTTSNTQNSTEERLSLVWFIVLPFAVVLQLPATFFIKQAMTMQGNIGKFKIPPAALQSAIPISIIILIPVVHVFTRNKNCISVRQRMGIGMFVSVIAMIIAAITERKRLLICRSTNVPSEDVPFSIFWLLPQYFLLGISDIFTVVGIQEFFYSNVPVGMRAMGIALYSSVFGVGSFLGAILISIIERLTSDGDGEGNWFSDDMAKARLDKYYWFLAFCSALSMIAFVAYCRFFKR